MTITAMATQRAFERVKQHEGNIEAAIEFVISQLKRRRELGKSSPQLAEELRVLKRLQGRKQRSVEQELAEARETELRLRQELSRAQEQILNLKREMRELEGALAAEQGKSSPHFASMAQQRLAEAFAKEGK